MRRNRLHLFPFNNVKRKRLTKNYKAFDLQGIIKINKPKEQVVKTIPGFSLNATIKNCQKTIL